MASRDSSRTARVSAKWRKLFALLPGYDPVRTAAPGEWFDEGAAEDVCEFFPTCLSHIEGHFAGQPFELRPDQKAFVGALFGWKRKDGSRRYREVFYGVPRGNGKTPLVGGVAIYLHQFDKEAGVQGYVVACDIPQAALAYRHVKGMISRNRELSDYCDIQETYKSIVLKSDPASVFKVVSSDAMGKHGAAPHFYICEELHAWQGIDLMEAIESGFAKKGRRQPLLIHVTTRDFDRPSVCNRKWAYAEQVKQGIVKDSAFLPIIYAAKDEDDWTDEAVWERCNPGIDVTVDRTSLRRMCNAAQADPAIENTFKRLHLNMRTEQDMRVIQLDQWDGNVDAFDLRWFTNHTSYVGIDLASTEDLASVAVVAKGDDDVVRVLHVSFCPEKKIKDRTLRQVPYDQWAEAKWIIVTPGDTTDYRVIKAYILGLRDEHGLDIGEVDFDPAQANQIMLDLMDDGFNVKRVPQSLVEMNPPTKEFLRRNKAGTLKHQDDPVLRWAASNMAIHFSGKLPAGADLGTILEKVPIMPSKQSSPDKIDPVVAVILGLKGLVSHADTFGGECTAYDDPAMCTL